MAQDRRRWAEPTAEFLFDVDKWDSSKSAQRMSFSQRGVYLGMLFYQWKKRNLPDDAQQVAELIAVTAEQQAEVIAAWEVVRRKFVVCEGEPSRVYNVALEHTRRKQVARFRRRQTAGREAGLASGRKRQTAQALPVNQSLTTVERPSTTGQPSSTVRIGKEGKGREGISEVGGREEVSAARSKRPIFSGQRFVVHEWQLDDLMRMLGDHVDGFDLHEWFFALDAQVLKSKEAIPQRDGGAWLQAQTLAEAQRRGIVVAAGPEAYGKQTTKLLSAVANLSDRR